MTEGLGYITRSSEVPARPLTQNEAQDAFAAIAAMGDRIAFSYLLEGCECRAQLMIEELVARGISATTFSGRMNQFLVARTCLRASSSKRVRRDCGSQRLSRPMVLAASSRSPDRIERLGVARDVAVGEWGAAPAAAVPSVPVRVCRPRGIARLAAAAPPARRAVFRSTLAIASARGTARPGPDQAHTDALARPRHCCPGPGSAPRCGCGRPAALRVAGGRGQRARLGQRPPDSTAGATAAPPARRGPDGYRTPRPAPAR